MLVEKLKALTNLYESKIEKYDIQINSETLERLNMVKMAIRKIFKESMEEFKT
ncbi:MAG: hypothetical protein ACTSRP_15405 [Candidatus Helarchaeota archaeon]